MMICRSLGFVAWSAHSTQVRQKCITLAFSTMLSPPIRPCRVEPQQGTPSAYSQVNLTVVIRKLRRLGADQAKEKAPARTGVIWRPGAPYLLSAPRRIARAAALPVRKASTSVA